MGIESINWKYSSQIQIQVPQNCTALIHHMYVTILHQWA